MMVHTAGSLFQANQHDYPPQKCLKNIRLRLQFLEQDGSFVEIN